MSQHLFTTSFLVPRDLKDRRFDSTAHFLLKKTHSPEVFSRALVTRLIEEGRVLLNGVVVKPRTKVCTGDRIDIHQGVFEVLSPAGLPGNKDVPVQVLFENNDFLVLSKPAGVQMHPAKHQTRTTLADFVAAWYPSIKNVGEDPLRPGIVHRLDRETSGILVVAKTQESFSALKAKFQKRTIKKTYVALVNGHLPELSGTIDAPLTRDSGTLKRRVARETESAPVRLATTEYRVIARYTDFDLVLAFPRTGRTHQIRVHFSSLGHPVLGDTLYAFKSMKRSKKGFPKRQMLHAWRLEWELFGEAYSFSAPLPKDFRGFFSAQIPTFCYDDAVLKTLT